MGQQLKEKHPGATLYACYEAGPCGYWLHRQLEKLGVKSYVVAPVALNGRRRRHAQRREGGQGRVTGPASAVSVL